MASKFENEINSMNKFITVNDSTNIKHAEIILQYLVKALGNRDPLFSSFFTGYSMAGNIHKHSTFEFALILHHIPIFRQLCG